MMFATPDQLPDQGLPRLATRKALLVVSMQNDLFYVKDDFYVTQNPEIIPRMKEMVPYFRKYGDVIWVNTETGSSSATQSRDAARVEGDSTKLAEKNRKARMKEEAELEDDTPRFEDDAKHTVASQLVYPSSRARDLMTQASADTRTKKRSEESHLLDDTEGEMADLLTKPRKGQKSQFCIAGTKGAEICDELKDIVDESRDMIVTKHFYSAFDQTSLLRSLRMSLTTEIYLCGTFTNTSVYSTAADAVQHGLQVTVVEDCLGYRNEEKHDEAMRQMSDIMGVNGIDSEEVIMECGGRETQTPGVTLRDLSISSETNASQAALIAQSQQGRSVSEANRQKTPKGKSERRSLTRLNTQNLGPSDAIGSGDSKIIHDALSSQLSEDIFDRLKEEVDWQKMYHRSGEVPRLVAVQGEIGKHDEVPIYRHPADESPPLLSFSPTLQKIRKEVERLLSQPFNHALIQLYRTGEDNISEHADKTLDLVRDSSVINVSLGAQRVMTLRTKKANNKHGMESSGVRQTQRIPMPHNSVFVLGPQTNRGWLHGIRADRRPVSEKSEEELSFKGERISITFRQIGTFMDEDAKRIWGSGAKNKTRAKAGRISNNEIELDKMIQAFGKENHQPDFNWDTEYGAGFDVVDLINREATLTLCHDPVANLRVRLALTLKSVPHKTIQAPKPSASPAPTSKKFLHHPWTNGLANLDQPTLKALPTSEDSHTSSSTTTEGDLAILFHLETQHPTPIPHDDDDPDADSAFTTAQLFRCAAQSNELLYMWRELQANPPSSPTHRFKLERPVYKSPWLKEIEQVVQSWEEYLEEEGYEFVAGWEWTILDCAFWPVLDCVFGKSPGEGKEGLGKKAFPRLGEYHGRGAEKAREAIEGDD